MKLLSILNFKNHPISFSYSQELCIRTRHQQTRASKNNRFSLALTGETKSYIFRETSIQHRPFKHQKTQKCVIRIKDELVCQLHLAKRCMQKLTCNLKISPSKTKQQSMKISTQLCHIILPFLSILLHYFAVWFVLFCIHARACMF